MVNVWDVVVFGILAAVVLAAVLLCIRTKQRGRSCCSGGAGCASCAKAGCGESKRQKKRGQM